MWHTRLVAIVILCTTLDASGAPLRVLEDRARGIRWELGWKAVSAYDTTTGERLRVVPLLGANQSGALETCAPDMILGRTGALIVSSNAQPSLWRISPARFEVERFDIVLDTDLQKDFGFTSLAWAEGEKAIHAGSAVTGSVWRIDLTTATGRKVESKGRASRTRGCAP